jgi:hypothetical protein
LKEVEARIGLFEKLRGLGSIPIWDESGRMIIVKAPPDSNWDERRDSLNFRRGQEYWFGRIAALIERPAPAQMPFIPRGWFPLEGPVRYRLKSGLGRSLSSFNDVHHHTLE